MRTTPSEISRLPKSDFWARADAGDADPLPIDSDESTDGEKLQMVRRFGSIILVVSTVLALSLGTDVTSASTTPPGGPSYSDPRQPATRDTIVDLWLGPGGRLHLHCLPGWLL